jgi:hypothetical protein
MIAFAQDPKVCSPPAVAPRAAHDDRFLELLPTICQHARYVFRHWPPEASDEAIQEVIANAFVAYKRLVAQGK